MHTRILQFIQLCVSDKCIVLCIKILYSLSTRSWWGFAESQLATVLWHWAQGVGCRAEGSGLIGPPRHWEWLVMPKDYLPLVHAPTARLSHPPLRRLDDDVDSHPPLFYHMREGRCGGHHRASALSRTTEGPLWGHPRCGLGAVGAVLEPFCGHLSPKIDKVY